MKDKEIIDRILTIIEKILEVELKEKIEKKDTISQIEGGEISEWQENPKEPEPNETLVTLNVREDVSVGE